MSVVASVATYEKRVDYIRPTVESIVAQRGVDRVLVMTGSQGVQERAREVCVGLPVECAVVNEIGPGKKHLAPLLLLEPSDIVVTFDDDRIYDPGHAEVLTSALEASDGPTGLIGYLAASPVVLVLNGPCDFLHGEYGWAYRAEWIPTLDVISCGERPELFHNDDVYLGWLLSKLGMRCYAVQNPGLRSSVGVNEASRAAATARNIVGARQRFRGAFDATWWTTRPLQTGRPMPELSSFFVTTER